MPERRYCKEVQLGEIADIQMGYSFRSRLEHEFAGEVAVVQMKDIDDSNTLRSEVAARVTLPEVKSHHLLRPGDVLFRSRGRSNGAALVPDGIGAAVLAAPMLLIRPHEVSPEYLCWFINTPAGQAQLATRAEGTSVRMINTEAIKSLRVPLPPLAIQRNIAQAAALIDREHVLASRIATLRQRLSHHLLLRHANETEKGSTCPNG